MKRHHIYYLHHITYEFLDKFPDIIIFGHYSEKSKATWTPWPTHRINHNTNFQKPARFHKTTHFSILALSLLAPL